MPTKEEIKANKAEAKALRKTLTAIARSNAKACQIERRIIRKHTLQLEKLQREHTAYTAKVNRRLAILEGRNEA